MYQNWEGLGGRDIPLTTVESGIPTVTGGTKMKTFSFQANYFPDGKRRSLTRNPAWVDIHISALKLTAPEVDSVFKKKSRDTVSCHCQLFLVPKCVYSEEGVTTIIYTVGDIGWAIWTCLGVAFDHSGKAHSKDHIFPVIPGHSNCRKVWI